MPLSHQTSLLTLTSVKGGETQPMNCIDRSQLTCDVSIGQSPGSTVSFLLAASAFRCLVLNLVEAFLSSAIVSDGHSSLPDWSR
jgi:hypothetical protein